MNPLCPRCSGEMTKTEVPRIAFHCGPCREMIQFFHVRTDADAQRFFRPSDDAKVIRPMSVAV
ncbi:MAG: hypothetical protein JWQ17_545 [Tardiphaga sp.]|jgi:hypothetical protein|nr:hypothetical protein [Tardiphaga sp.]